MLKLIRGFIFILIIFSLTPLYSTPVTPNHQPAVGVLLQKVQRLDREISRVLGKTFAADAQRTVLSAQREDFKGYRAQLRQILRQGAKLDRSSRHKIEVAVHQALKKMTLLDKTKKNVELRARARQRSLRQRHLVPEKTARPAGTSSSPKRIRSAPASADDCSGAEAVTFGTYFGSTVDATNDGSEGCIGDPTEDIWYSFASPVTGEIRVDTIGSDFDTVLSVHDSTCPGTARNEITCNDDCSDVDSCVSFFAQSGTTYLIRVGGYSIGQVGSVQLNVQQPGMISGTITDSVTSAPLQDAFIEIYDSNGNSTDYGYTDATGHYTVTTTSGTHYVFASGSSGSRYMSELYDNISCINGDCDPTTGTPVQVTGGGEASGIDLALDPGGSISGTLTEDGSGLPITDSEVDIYDAQGDWVSYDYTDSSGHYKAGALPSGTYYVTASGSDYKSEVYNDIPCVPYCDPTSGTPVQVTVSVETTGIDFQLTHLGHIEGTITNENTGEPISDVEVEIYSPSGWQGYAYSDNNGHYIVRRLQTGNFYAVTYDNSYKYVNEVYDNITCLYDCNLLNGTPIPVTSGETTSGINFALKPGGKITGHIFDTSNQPVPYGSVIVYDTSANEVGYGQSHPNGGYEVGGLPTGTYFVYADGYNYFGQVYDGLSCTYQSCTPVAGTPIPVVVSQTVSGINFHLVLGGSIQGHVVDAQTHNGIDYAQIDIFDNHGEWLSYAYTDQAGNYSAGGLESGNYFASLNTYGDYVNELYNNIPCRYCDPTTGTPIAVTVSEATVDIDFDLDHGGSISGVVRDAETNIPIEAYVDIFDADGNYSSYAYADSNGRYTARGLYTGNHFALAYGYGYVDYVPELFDNIPCVYDSCDVTTGTPIPVIQGDHIRGIDFSLEQSVAGSQGQISGMITDAGSGLPISNARVDIYNDSGNYIGYGYTDGSGHYTSGFLPAGNCFAVANSQDHVAELFDNISCPFNSCNVLTGTPIQVNAGEITSGIDFALGTGGTISGTVTDAASHLPLDYAYVNVYTESGAYATSGYADADGHYAAHGLPPGMYFAMANASGFADRLYQDLPCPSSCDPTTGTPIAVNDVSETSGIDFALTTRGRISGHITRESDGTALGYAWVYIYDQSGDTTAYGYADESGNYTTDFLDDGTYYAVAGSYHFVSELYNNIPCPMEQCNPLTGAPIAVASGQTVQQIDFALADGGGIRGVVYNPVTGEPLSDSEVKILDSGGHLLAVTHAWYGGQYEALNLPPGNYYVLAKGMDEYEDQLYQGVSCPDETCSLTEGTLVPVVAGETAGGINFPMIETGCLFCEDFNDGNLPAWNYGKSVAGWSEASGDLVGSSTKKTAVAYADVFAGCSICRMELTVQASQSSNGKAWIYGWHSGKSNIELQMREGKDVWILKERVNGSVTQKAKARKHIDPDIQYRVRMVFDGVQLRVFIDDMTTALITITPKSAPNGSVGLGVKNTVASFGYIHVN